MIRSFEKVTPKIGANCYIDETSVVVGDVELGEDCSVWPMTVIRGDVNAIRIGDRTNIQDGSVFHVSHAGDFNPNGAPLIVGRDVTVGHKVILHACTVGNECLIGMGAVVMDDAVIEDQVIVGAGSLVTPGKRLQSGYLYVGNPCRKSRELTQGELNYLRYSADHYVRLKNRHMNSEQ